MADPAGAAIVGASLVAIESPATGRSESLTTDRAGEFLFGELPPGTYRLRLRAGGFEELFVAWVTVELGRTTRLAPVLHLATQALSVRVPSEPELPPFEAPVNANLSPSDLQSLPLDGRRFQSLAPLTPLVNAEDTTPGDDAADSNGASETGDPPADTDNARLSVRGPRPHAQPVHAGWTEPETSL